MNLDELQSAQARERQSSDLQHLRPSFYAEVGEFIESLQAERARVVEEADDPFSSPEVRRITDDIETAEGTVEAIYERRVGKVVKKASIAAADMPVDDDGMTAEEERLFEDLVARIEENRETVLSVLDGDPPNVSCSITDEETGTADPSTAAGESAAAAGDSATNATDSLETPPESAGANRGVSAADLMGSGTETEASASGRSAEDPSVGTPDPSSETPNPSPETPNPSAEGPNPPAETTKPSNPDELSAVDDAGPATDRTAVPPASGPPEADGSTNDESDDARDVPGVPRTTVRITSDVGEMVGADNRDYELGAEDVVTLPEPNADVLIEKNAAERLE